MFHLLPSPTTQNLGQHIQVQQMPSPPVDKGSEYQAGTRDSHNGNQHRPPEMLGTREYDCRGICKKLENVLPDGLDRGEGPTDFGFHILTRRSTLSFPACLKGAKTHLLDNNLNTQIEASQPHATEYRAAHEPACRDDRLIHEGPKHCYRRPSIWNTLAYFELRSSSVPTYGCHK
ncbi:hypothetical protein LA080_006717 [Diaporthe eres]|nr:hypothetical protein LA080_006717 [Diaporthe eres]